MNSQPRISIVLPTYNGAQFLATSIESCIQQKFQSWELIIVDDASTDNTPEIISQYIQKDFRIKSIRHPKNRKLPAALNTGFEQALGEYLTWTSDDNIYRPEALLEMANFLDKHPDVDFVYADYTLVDLDGNPIREIAAESPDLITLGDIIGGCFLYRRIVHETLGGYNEEFFLAEDFDFYLRAMISFKLQPLQINLYEYREHALSLTKTRSSEVHKAWEKSFRQHLPKMYWMNADKLSLTLTRLAKRAFKHRDYLNAIKYFTEAILKSPIYFVRRFFTIVQERYIKKNTLQLLLRAPITRVKLHIHRDEKKQYRRAIRWIRKNTIRQTGIAISNKRKMVYPEVTGYYIPTLLQWGLKDEAILYANWLVSIQNSDGSWSGPDSLSNKSFTFDTGQILKGLMALVDYHPEYKLAAIKGCDWMISQIDEQGRISSHPDIQETWLEKGKNIPEAYHLYALEPVKQAGEKWELERFTKAVDRALAFYLADETLTTFNALSHFHAYILEALVDLGEIEIAMQGMKDLETYQRSDGMVPAYASANWVCSTGLFQYAVIWYKLNQPDRADRAFEFAKRLQNLSGGFFGSYGLHATYFYNQEISWAVKYFLDALWWKNSVQNN